MFLSTLVPTVLHAQALSAPDQLKQLGYFEDEKAAARQYDQAVRETRGAKATTNFPNSCRSSTGLGLQDHTLLSGVSTSAAASKLALEP